MLTRNDLVPLGGAPLPCATDGVQLPPWPVDYDPVVSLSIVRPSDGGTREEILVGVRDARTNRYHPDVVSVPTRRVHHLGLSLFEMAMSGAVSSWLLEYVVREVAGSKLAVGDWFENNPWTAVVRRFDFGESVIGPDQTERLGMIGVEVQVGTDCPIPASTSSYSELAWLELTDFLDLAVTRDSTIMPIGLRAAEVCVHGLCMHSAAEIVAETRPWALSAMLDRNSRRG